MIDTRALNAALGVADSEHAHSGHFIFANRIEMQVSPTRARLIHPDPFINKADIESFFQKTCAFNAAPFWLFCSKTPSSRPCLHVFDFARDDRSATLATMVPHLLALISVKDTEPQP